MKINTSSLSKALAALLPVASKRTTLPVLNMIRVEAVKGVLTLQATNLESFVSLQVECEGELVACCVPAKTFKSVVGFGDTTELEVITGRLHVTTEGSSIEIPVLPADTFPGAAEVREAVLAVNCAELAKAIDRAGYAFSTDISRAAFQCVMFSASRGQMSVRTIDGRQMAEYLLACDAEIKFMVPAGEIHPLVSALEIPGAEMRVGENWIQVGHQQGFTQVKLSDLAMPPVHQVADEARKVKNLASLKRSEMASALEICRGFITNQVGSVKLEPKKGRAEISLASNSGAVANTVTCDKALEATAFDPDYMLNALRRLTGDLVSLGYEDNKSPIVISEPPFMAIVMPTRLL